MPTNNLIHLNKLILSVAKHIAVVTFDCPPESPIDLELASNIRTVCQFIETDPEIRVALFIGTGANFCSGRSEIPLETTKGTIDELTEWINAIKVADHIADLSVPVVMAINGNVSDHGLELALAGDIRIAEPDIQLGLTDINKGILGWDGGTQRLPRLVGKSWANDLILTGRTISAAEALSMGLINRISRQGHISNESLSLAESITEGGPIASKYLKEAMYKGIDMTLPQ